MDAPKNLRAVVLVGVVLAIRRRVSAVQHPMPQVRRVEFVFLVVKFFLLPAVILCVCFYIDWLKIS